MTDESRTTADGVRWSGRIAVVGLAIAAVIATVATLGLSIPGPVYWFGIVLSLGGVLGATAFISRSSNVAYGVGVVSTVAGVLVTGYGLENGVLLATGLGFALVVAGVTGVVVDTRRGER